MISITGPIQPAIAHTRRILFEPFSGRKWFVLGFLAQFGEDWRIIQVLQSEP